MANKAITYKVVVDEYGDRRWFVDGKISRHDGPAVECASGSMRWYVDDKLHREDGPAVEYVDGTKFWYVGGKRHREDGPAIEYASGVKYWYVDGNELTKVAFDAIIAAKQADCVGKVVTVDGKKYRLEAV